LVKLGEILEVPARTAAGAGAPRGELDSMPADLAAHLLRKSVRSMRAGAARCARCRRSPLPGEVLHVLDGDKTVCSLCRARAGAPAGDGPAVRVGTGHPRLRVTPLER
jgi:hypothetical protein